MKFRSNSSKELRNAISSCQHIYLAVQHPDVALPSVWTICVTGLLDCAIHHICSTKIPLIGGVKVLHIFKSASSLSYRTVAH